MPLLSKSEIQYLQGQKQVSKSYEYKLKSIIKKKVANLMDKEIPLLSTLFPSLDLTEFGNMFKDIQASKVLTEFGKVINNKIITNNLEKLNESYNNFKNCTYSDTHKLYKCTENNQIKRVRSVVRISRRSSEPQIVGSKPIGPVNHTDSNNSSCILREGDKTIAG